jgi:two-component system sensor histidine kinase MprB
VPHREAVRLDLLTADVVCRRQQRSPGVTVHTVLEACLVRVDPAAVDRAIGNLVDNAIKWSPSGGCVHVDVVAGKVSVTDDGPGVAAEDVPHIFERFYRASAARGMPGAGLGLAIVGQVAQANGGTVDMRTGPAGSTFILAFPKLAPSPLSPAPGLDPGTSSTTVQPPLETEDATPAS